MFDGREGSKPSLAFKNRHVYVSPTSLWGQFCWANVEPTPLCFSTTVGILMIDHLQFGRSNSQTSTSSLSFWSLSINPFFHHFPKMSIPCAQYISDILQKRTAGWLTSYIPIGKNLMICPSIWYVSLKNIDRTSTVMYMAKTWSFTKGITMPSQLDSLYPHYTWILYPTIPQWLSLKSPCWMRKSQCWLVKPIDMENRLQKKCHQNHDHECRSCPRETTMGFHCYFGGAIEVTNGYIEVCSKPP